MFLWRNFIEMEFWFWEKKKKLIFLQIRKFWNKQILKFEMLQFRNF